MREGLYRVQTWNGKDGTLVNEQGDYIVLTKNDLTPQFKDRMLPGEQILFKWIPVLADPQGSEDERERQAHVAFESMSQRAKELMRKEAERRARYGANPGIGAKL